MLRRAPRRGRPSLRRPKLVLANGSSVFVDPINMCRVCLSDKHQVYTDVTRPDEPNLIHYVNEYYKVDIKIDDKDNGKSTKLCQFCIEYIDIWRGQISAAASNQLIVNFLAEKSRYVSSIAASTVAAETATVAAAAATAAETVAAAAAIAASVAETVAATAATAATAAAETAENATTTPRTVTKSSSFASKKKSKSSSKNNIKKRCKKRKRSISIHEHGIPLTSTSSDMYQSPSESTQNGSDFPSSSNSTGNIPFASTLTEIPFESASTEFIPFASTSTEITPFASTSTEITPFASTSTEITPFASTSTEITPFASTSTEITPFASTSTEIIPSYTINETLGANPIWYSIAEFTDDVPPPEVLPKSNLYKSENVCIFCTYQQQDISLNLYKRIIFCPKHSQPHACLVENCHSVFPNKDLFISHYRSHLSPKKSTFFCRQCFGVLTCWRRKGHTHQNVSDLFKCCSLTFPSMIKFAIHKLINHSALVVSSNGQTRILKKLNMSVQKTELDDVKGDLDIPDKVSCNVIIKDNGSIKCFCCPLYFTTVLEFINHTKIKHNNLITLKEKGIKLCPLCENSYFIEHFSEHIEMCTNTLKVGENSLNYYGCVHCKIIFTDLSAREIRNHVLYCKSFKLGIVNNKLHHKCVNCTFTSTDDTLCLEHANSDCIYFQLKMRYAMGPNEKNKVIERMEFIKQNTQQQEDENNEQLLGITNEFCNIARQKLLKCYKYYCNNCKNHFFDQEVFFKHLTLAGSYCRSPTLIYCQKCVTDFETVEEYRGHLPKMPESTPIVTIKQEQPDQNNDEGGDIFMDVVLTNHNYYDVKVFEMNNGTFFQKQEPSNLDDISDTQYQEQEQEVSNIALNYSFECQEMEMNNGIYMQCEVEDKPDLSNLSKRNSE